MRVLEELKLYTYDLGGQHAHAVHLPAIECQEASCSESAFTCLPLATCTRNCVMRASGLPSTLTVLGVMLSRMTGQREILGRKENSVHYNCTPLRGVKGCGNEIPVW